ncbi:MAG: helix-turn-helix domain-containing protein [Candidatus Methanosuratincola sp.]
MTEENEILKKLVVEEKDMIKELEKLVEEASKYFQIEKPSGKIIFKDFGALTNKQRIAIVLLGKYFAKKLNLIENDSLGISEISKELGIPRTSLSGPIKDLIREGYVEYLPGRKYKIAYHRIKELFDKILVTQSR